MSVYLSVCKVVGNGSEASSPQIISPDLILSYLIWSGLVYTLSFIYLTAVIGPGPNLDPTPSRKVP